MFKFLKKKAKTVTDKLANIALAYLAMVFITIGVLIFYKWLFEVDSYTAFGFGGIFDQFFIPVYKHPFWIDFIAGCVLAPISEEIIFRHLPLRVLKAAGKEKELLLPSILFTSTVFGLMHQGYYSLLIQGVGGLIFSVVYIKNGYSLYSSILSHALWNATLTLGILSLNL